MELLAEKKSDTSPEKVLVIGLGQLGLPVAKYVKQKGFDTYGYDINQNTMEIASKNYGIKKIDTFGDIDVFILCISTHKPDDIYSQRMDLLFQLRVPYQKEHPKEFLKC